MALDAKRPIVLSRPGVEPGRSSALDRRSFVLRLPRPDCHLLGDPGHEDACRARTEHAAENLAIMRHIAHQVLGRVKKAHHCGYVVAQRYVMWSDEELGKAVFGKVVD